jgi:uncharacterized protein DUF5995
MRPMTVIASILERTPVSRIDDVLARLREIDAVLPAADGVACFNKLYLATTANVIAAARSGVFSGVRFIQSLDVVFANLYFSALKANEVGAADTPRAWRALFESRARTDVAPVQFALAGMNAHINRDLPVALVRTFSALGREPERPSLEWDDYERVDGVVAATEATVKEQYLTPLLHSLERMFDGVDDVVANWSIAEARAAAWINAEALWRLRAHPTLESDYVVMLDGMVGFAGRGLLVATATDRR